MTNIRTRFHEALTFSDYLQTVEKNDQLWKAINRHVKIPPDLMASAKTLPGNWKLLALSEDWCGDAVNILPVVAAFAEAIPNLQLKVLPRDENLDIMDAHLTNGKSRSIPIVVVYDENFQERGWWGPRPTPIQEWVIAKGLQLDKEERYRKVRQYYARDKGRTIVRELLDTIQRAAEAEVVS